MNTPRIPVSFSRTKAGLPGQREGRALWRTASARRSADAREARLAGHPWLPTAFVAVTVLVSGAALADRTTAEGHVRSGSTDYVAGAWAQAEAHFTDAITADGTWAIPYNNRGLARMRQSSFTAAEADFESAKSKDAAYLAPYINKGKSLAAQGKLAEATAELQAGLAKSPTNAKLLFNLGWVLDEQGKYTEAVAKYDSALSASSKYGRALVGKGVSLAKSGSTGTAVTAFYAAINALETGDLFAAMAAYDLEVLRGGAIGFHSASAAQRFQDGLFAMSAGLDATAVSQMEQARAEESDVPHIPWALSWAYLKTRDTKNAATALEAAHGLMSSIDVRGWYGASVSIDGIPRGTVPRQVKLLPAQSELSLRTSSPTRERSVVVYGDRPLPGGLQAMAVLLASKSTMPPFAPLTDSDGDWLADDWEIASLGNLSGSATDDPDGDGLSNLREYWLGSNPKVADTDGNGVKDGNQLRSGSDPSTGSSLPALALAPQKRAYLVAASAHAGGMYGSSWVSDVVMHNPGDTAAAVTLCFLPTEQDNMLVGSKRLEVPPGQSLMLADVLKETFGVDAGSGAILIASDVSLVVTSRTYNGTSDGTFGQYGPGPAVTTAIVADEQVRLIQLTRNGNYRTNVGFANATSKRTTVTADFYAADGKSLGRRTQTLEPFGHVQDTDAIGQLGASAEDAFAVISSTTSGASYFAYASVIDNRTGDPINVVPVGRTGSFLSPTFSGSAIYVPAAAHAGGAQGAAWRTDLEVHNAGFGDASFGIALLKRDQPNPQPETRNFQLAQGRSVRYVDVLDSVFHFSGAASLRITPTAGVPMITSRTYNDTPWGTFGLFSPGWPQQETVAAYESVRLVQLSQAAATSSGYRTNIGVLNTSGTPISLTAKLHKDDGTLLGTQTWALGPYESAQYDKVFQTVTAADVPNGFAVLSTDTAGGSFAAYATVVDNRTNDPIYIPAQSSCGVEVRESLVGVGAAGSTGTVTVTASDPWCPWGVVSTVPWITVTGGASHTGSGTVSYSVAANKGQARQGTLVVGRKVVNFSQVSGCAVQIAPKSADVPMAGGTGSVAVTASDAACPWTAASNAPWLSITSGASGTGSGTVAYSVAANASVGRLGILTIGGNEFVVNQAGIALPTVTVSLPGNVPLVMVRIPAGTFQMGSPTSERGRDSGETVHQVTLTSDYFLAKYEVTQAQWRAVTGSAMPTSCTDYYGSGDNYPVYCVSWGDIAGPGGFLEKLNAHLSSTGQPGAGKFRLPTEAEWERGARGETQTRFSFGNALECDDYCVACSVADPYVWWCGNSGRSAKPVGSKKANPYGLYDMHGNLWEWCQDWWGVYDSGAQTDPKGPSTGTYRVSRGGGSYADLKNARPAFRYSGSPAERKGTSGFRPAMSP